MDHLDLLMVRMIQVNKNFKVYQKYLNEFQLTMQMITERDAEAKYCILLYILLFIIIFIMKIVLRFYKSLVKEFGGKGVSHFKHYLSFLEV